MGMRSYKDYMKDKSKSVFSMTEDELKSVEWLKYKIVVPTQEEKVELQKVFKHIHYSDAIDSNSVGVNQISHEYLGEEDGGNNIIVDSELYDKLKVRK